MERFEVEVKERALGMLREVEDHVAQGLRDRTPTNWTGVQSAVVLAVMLGWREGREPLDGYYAAAERQGAAIAEGVAAGEHHVVEAHRAIVARIYRVAAANFRQQCLPGCSALVCEHDGADAADGHLKSWVNDEHGRSWVWLRHCDHGHRVGSNHEPEELERALSAYEARGCDCSTIRKHITRAKAANGRAAA